MTDREALIDVFERLDIRYVADALPGPADENSVMINPAKGYLGYRCEFLFNDDGSFDHVILCEI